MCNLLLSIANLSANRLVSKWYWISIITATWHLHINQHSHLLSYLMTLQQSRMFTLGCTIIVSVDRKPLLGIFSNRELNSINPVYKISKNHPSLGRLRLCTTQENGTESQMPCHEIHQLRKKNHYLEYVTSFPATLIPSVIQTQNPTSKQPTSATWKISNTV